MGMRRQKKDIEWQAVRDWHLQQAKNRFRSLEKLFLTGERDKDIYGITTADGIYLNGRLLYQKGTVKRNTCHAMAMTISHAIPLTSMPFWARTDGSQLMTL